MTGGSHDAALGHLLRQLAEADAALDEGDDPAHAERMGATMALQAIRLFLGHHGRLQGKALLRLQGAIEDADCGRRNPFWQSPRKPDVEGNKPGGAPGASITDDMGMVLAAVAIDLLLDAGEGLDAAAEKVDRALGAESPGARALINFRIELSGERKSAALIESYKRLRLKYRTPKASDPDCSLRARAAHSMLAAVGEMGQRRKM